MAHLAIITPCVLLLVVLAWRTIRVNSAHRKIAALQKEVDGLRAELREWKEANPYSWMAVRRTAN